MIFSAVRWFLSYLFTKHRQQHPRWGFTVLLLKLFFSELIRSGQLSIWNRWYTQFFGGVSLILKIEQFFFNPHTIDRYTEYVLDNFYWLLSTKFYVALCITCVHNILRNYVLPLPPPKKKTFFLLLQPFKFIYA